MRIFFWIDPFDTLNVKTDTTMAFMREACARGHDVFYFLTNAVSLRQGKLLFEVFALKTDHLGELFQSSDSPILLDETHVDVVMIRKDPPFDRNYLCQTWLLDCLNDRIVVSNSPRALCCFNEKIWISRFPDWTPPTLITTSFEQYQDFYKTQGSVILKPYDAFGGQGVCLLEPGAKNASVLFELLSEGEQKPVIVQKYLNRAVDGDKRILLLNGEILGAILRIPAPSEHRSNLVLGATAQPCKVSFGEKTLIESLKPFFQKEGLHFVGLDIIDEKIVEVNVTSPTCLLAMNTLYGLFLEKKVMDFLEEQVSFLS